jgi:hypothetical protein
MKAFAPALSVSAGADTNIIFVLDFTVAAAGFNVETRANTSNMSFVGAASAVRITPNTLIGGPNPPGVATQSPPVPVYDRGTLAVTVTDRNPNPYIERAVFQQTLRIELTASSIEAVQLASVTLRLNGNVSGSHAEAHFWWDVNKNGITSTGEGDIDYGDHGFGSGDVTFSGSPLLTVPSGQTVHLIVTLYIYPAAPLGRTAGVQVTAAGSLPSTGATSGLAITPTGSFALASDLVPITA